MNAGKSTALLQSNYNYQEKGMNTLLFLPKIDADSSDGKIHSRIGLVAEAESVDRDFNFFDFVSNEKIDRAIHCILIDEVQFLTRDQIRQVCKISDELNIPAMCYGIRTDFQGKLFEGSSELLALADNLIELKTVCDCGRKAIMVVRLDENGNIVRHKINCRYGIGCRMRPMKRFKFWLKDNSILYRSYKVLKAYKREIKSRDTVTSPIESATNVPGALWTFDETEFKEYGVKGLKVAGNALSKLSVFLKKRNISLTIIVYPWPDQIVSCLLYTSPSPRD